MSFNEQDENGIDRKQVGTEAVKCKSCGSNMQFDPDTQSLYCEHCGSRVEINGQIYIAEDTGGAIKGNRIDMCVSSHAEAYRRGVLYNVPVHIVK